VLSLNTWYHISGTWDGETLRIYVNGVEAGTPKDLTGTGVDNCPNGLAIGRINSVENYNYFDGKIDEVTIWNRALNAGEISDLMSGPLVCENEDCETPGDEDSNGLADCQDPACPEETYCNAENTMLCAEGECVDACTGTLEYLCDPYGHCDMDAYPLGNAQCERDSPGSVCCVRTSPITCDEMDGACTFNSCAPGQAFPDGDDSCTVPGTQCCIPNNECTQVGGSCFHVGCDIDEGWEHHLEGEAQCVAENEIDWYCCVEEAGEESGTRLFTRERKTAELYSEAKKIAKGEVSKDFEGIRLGPDEEQNVFVKWWNKFKNFIRSVVD